MATTTTNLSEPLVVVTTRQKLELQPLRTPQENQAGRTGTWRRGDSSQPREEARQNG